VDGVAVAGKLVVAPLFGCRVAQVLRSLITARVVKGEAPGFPIKLTADDQRSLAEFATRIGD